MADFNIRTISRILSGEFSLDNITIGTFITREDISNKNVVGDFTSIEYFSLPTNPAVVVTEAGAYSFSRSVYLSAFKTTFSDIVTDYTNESLWFCTFLSGVDLNSSYILATQSIFNPSIIGQIDFSFSNSQVLRLTDYSNTYNLYRKFREKLFKNQIGNLQSLDIKLALVDTTYSHDIETSEFYSDISSKVVASATIPGIFIQNDSLRTTAKYVKFTAVSGATFNNVVFYVDSGNPATSPLIGWYGPSSLNNVPFTPNGSDIYASLNGLLFDL